MYRHGTDEDPSSHVYFNLVARGEYVTQPRAMPPHVKRPGVSEKQGRHMSSSFFRIPVYVFCFLFLDPQKTKWGGWGSALLPIYTVGILLYVIYVIGKIMQKKVRIPNMF